MEPPYLATCPDAIQDILGTELLDCGATRITKGYRMLRFDASLHDWYQMHLRLSTASKLFQVLRDCPAARDDILYFQARKIPWPEVLSPGKSFKINGIAGDRGQNAMGSNQISKQIRLAIEDSMRQKTGTTPQVSLQNPDLEVTCHIRRQRATICINTSGKALHKRGYRTGGHPAPLKETMAASLLRLAGYDGSQNFSDPMCGSGTILIEAAFIALNKACNIHRKKGQFALEHLPDFDRRLWREAQDELRDRKLSTPQHILAGSDLHKGYVQMSRENALRARVEKHLRLSCQSFFDSKKPADTGILLTNLPYGERIDIEGCSLKDFYRRVGDTLKQRYGGWRACLFVNEASPWKHIGLRPAKKISLLNGSIPAKLLIFDLYEGSRKKAKAQEHREL